MVIIKQILVYCTVGGKSNSYFFPVYMKTTLILCFPYLIPPGVALPGTCSLLTGVQQTQSWIEH